jgi:predicted RNase H-like nuclease
MERCDIRENIYAGSRVENIIKSFLDFVIKREQEKIIVIDIPIYVPLLAVRVGGGRKCF